MFVYPPQRVSQRLIYRLSDYKLTATLQNFERVPLPMDKDHLVLLAYLVRKYL